MKIGARLISHLTYVDHKWHLFAWLQLSVLFHSPTDEETTERPWGSWLYGSWIYYYPCNQWQSPLTLWVISITPYILLGQNMQIYEGIPVTIKQIIEKMKWKSMFFVFLFLAFVCLFLFCWHHLCSLHVDEPLTCANKLLQFVTN